jgi:hypothetical protein
MKVKLAIICISLVVFAVVGLVLIGPFRLSAYLRDRADNVPIVFYGRVVDANGNPISGARIQWQIRTQRLASLIGTSRFTTFTGATTTDTNGDFHINGYKGSMLWITQIEKPNFVWHKQAGPGNFSDGAFDYAPSSSKTYKPDPENPAVFPMRGYSDRGGTRYYRSWGGWIEGIRSEPEEVIPPRARR